MGFRFVLTAVVFFLRTAKSNIHASIISHELISTVFISGCQCVGRTLCSATCHTEFLGDLK